MVRHGRRERECDNAAMANRTPQPAGRRRAVASVSRQPLIATIGADIARFQEESTAFDEMAARVLGLERADLRCMTLLLFAGPASDAQLTSACGLPRRIVSSTIARLQLAGYARRQPGGKGSAVELTEHARAWVERLWTPLREEGAAMLAEYGTRELALVHEVLSRAGEVQQRHLQRLRAWLAAPSPSTGRGAHLRGGLSPAALRRVQVFVESNLGRPITLGDLAARAGLSLHHFARAFRVSTGITPRSFVEQRRLARAEQLLARSSLPLAAIAMDCGFGSQSRLTTAFRRRTGFTPAQFRRGAVPVRPDAG
jgi:AraC family transcriptional regulator